MSYTDNAQEADVAARFVAAQVNYFTQADIRPEVWNEDYTRNIVPVEPTDVRIVDAGSLPQPPTLDREGIALIYAPVDLAGLGVADEAAARYIAALAPVMLQLTGADEVTFAPNAVFRRAADKTVTDLANTIPAGFVHTDFAPQSVDKLIGFIFDPPKAPVRRKVSYNLWRLLSPGPTDLPLGILDARSVSPRDIVFGDNRFATFDFHFETILVRANPEHRWLYFPEMTADDLLVFKGYESDPDKPAFTPHTAFTDPTCPPGATPRVSVECRCMAYWY